MCMCLSVCLCVQVKQDLYTVINVSVRYQQWNGFPPNVSDDVSHTQILILYGKKREHPMSLRENGVCSSVYLVHKKIQQKTNKQILISFSSFSFTSFVNWDMRAINQEMIFVLYILWIYLFTCVACCHETTFVTP